MKTRLAIPNTVVPSGALLTPGGNQGIPGSVGQTGQTGQQGPPGITDLATTSSNGLLRRISGLSTDFVDGTNNCQDLIAVLSKLLVSTGVILPFAGENAPNGYLLCDGTLYLRSEYPELAEVVGTRFGGNTVFFNVPDCRGKVLAGTGANAWVLGGQYGAYTHQLTIAQMPSHTHVQNSHFHNLGNAQGTGAGGGFQLGGNVAGNASTTTATAVNQNTGEDTAHNNVQPTLGINYIIKT